MVFVALLVQVQNVQKKRLVSIMGSCILILFLSYLL